MEARHGTRPLFHPRNMSKKDTKDLLQFLKPFNTKTADLALWLRSFAWDSFPECNELIYDNYNAVAVGWSPTLTMRDIFCSVAVYSNTSVHFGFYWGSKLGDPKGLLVGNGKQYRYLRVSSRKDFPIDYARELMNEAYVSSLAAAKDLPSAPKGMTVVKSISPTKKRPVSKPA